MSQKCRIRKKSCFLAPLLLAFPTQTTAQEHIYISCQPTVFWSGDESRSGTFGLNFIVRSGNDGVYRWRAEERRWSAMIVCPNDPGFVATSGTVRTCTHNLGEGQARHVGESSQGGGYAALRTSFSVSRVTGAYRYETIVGGERRFWLEEGICSAAENPETQATQRVF